MFRVALFGLNPFILIMAIKFTRDPSFSETDILAASKGKEYLESINEKANVPHYGSCWKSAVEDLEIGCKYLSENVQSDLALKFTNCFMQMSGLEPVLCGDTGRETKEKCLKSLTDRAFNAFVEFYTHTQSMCYFLQNQIWHEEAEKTIEKLSLTSMHVSNQLEEAGKVQEELLLRQKQTLLLQHDLLDNGKSLALELELHRERINLIMEEFQSSTEEQKKALFDLFGKFTSLKSWAMGEMSWLNSVTFYLTSVVLSYFFTSTSRTQQARLYLFLLLTLNYFTEQYLYSVAIRDSDGEEGGDDNLTGVADRADSSVWLSRKVFVLFCATVVIFAALRYSDYNIINYRLLLEIKNQNLKILKRFNLNLTEKADYKPSYTSVNGKLSTEDYARKNPSQKIDIQTELPLLPYHRPLNENTDRSPISRYNYSFIKSEKKSTIPTPKYFNHDATDNGSRISKSPDVSDGNVSKVKSEPVHYNLRRSNRLKTYRDGV